MYDSSTEYRGHIIFAAATETHDSSWVASFSAWATPLLSPAGASIRGALVGPFYSRDAATLTIVNEGMRRLDELLGPAIPERSTVDEGLLGRREPAV